MMSVGCSQSSMIKEREGQRTSYKSQSVREKETVYYDMLSMLVEFLYVWGAENRSELTEVCEIIRKPLCKGRQALE